MIATSLMRAARAALGLTQLDVAKQVGVSYPAYRLWETGGTKPNPENEEKLKKVLKIEGDRYNGSKQHATA